MTTNQKTVERVGHTAGLLPSGFPWKRNPKNGRVILDAAGDRVLTVQYGSGTSPFELAAFVETAVNSHAGLLEACKAALAEFDTLAWTGSRVRTCEAIRAALAKAEGRVLP